MQAIKRIYTALGERCHFDGDGFPLNPWCATGIRGRGELRRWGLNLAADAMAFRYNPHTRQWEVCLLRRNDAEDRLAFPGGWLENYWTDWPHQAASRELEEETGNALSIAPERFNFLVPHYECRTSPRSTDNAWIETHVCSVELTWEESLPKLGDDTEGSTTDAGWFPVSRETLGRMYHHHHDLLLIGAAYHGININ